MADMAEPSPEQTEDEKLRDRVWTAETALRRIREALPTEEATATDRCPSCEHGWDMHTDPAGCWFTVTHGKPEQNAVCPCGAVTSSPIGAAGDLDDADLAAPDRDNHEVYKDVSTCGHKVLNCAWCKVGPEFEDAAPMEFVSPGEARVRGAEIRAAIAEHDSAAYRNQVKALLREIHRMRGGDPDDLPDQFHVVIYDETDHRPDTKETSA
ncbi:hypothetical protein [Streptomyces sp. NPDC006784]|uniref:hypothetical protein n=1 Tax=Streptomyces sp. NPDC006784 TaxID=3364764 RepID=UPI0036C36BF4